MSTETENGNEKADELAARGKHKKALAMYLKSSNYEKAGEMYEQLGQVQNAVAEFSRAGNHQRGGELLRSADMAKEASLLFIKAGNPKEAGEVLEQVGQLVEAARQFANAEEFERAAELYNRAGKTKPAARLYFKIDQADEGIRLLEEQNRLDIAAELCVEHENFDKAGAIYSQMGEHLEAAKSYLKAGLRTNALASFESAGSIQKASALCEEMGLLTKAGEYQEHMGNKVRAAELYHQAGRYEAAGRIFESENFLCEAAQMYEQDEKSAASAAKLFEKTFWSETIWEFETKYQVWGIALAEDAKQIVVCMGGPEVVLLDYDGRTIWCFRIPLGIRARNVAISADASLIAVGTEAGSVYMLDKFKKIIWKRELADQIRGLIIRDADNMIIAGCTDGTVYALSKDGKDLWQTKMDYKVWQVVNMPGTKRILVGCGSGTIQMLDLEGRPSRPINAGGWISRLALRSDERYAAAIIGMNVVHIYDLESQERVWEYEVGETLQDLGFLGDEQLLVGANSGAMILEKDVGILWRKNTSDRVMRIVVTQDGTQAYMGQFDDGLILRSFNDCLIFAARNYEKAREFEEAARLYEIKNELSRAADMHIQIEQLDKAAELILRLGEKERAALLYEQGEYFAEAATLFEELHFFEHAAKCYESAGDSAKAGQLQAELGDSIKAAELHLQSNDYAEAGKLFVEAGESEKAIDAYEQALDEEVLTIEGSIALGALYVTTEKFDQAIKLLQKIVTDEEFGSRAEHLLAEAFMQKGLFNLAIDHYREALKPDAEITTEKIEIWYDLAWAHERAYDYAEAKKTYKEILRLDYYYKDVSGRLERVNELSSVFDTAAPVNPFASDTHGSAPEGATMPMAQPGRYEVVNKLGEGGMGIVYLARDTKLGREIAMKVLSKAFSDNMDFKKRFIREARAVASLNHKNVVAIYDIVEEMGQNFISMEFVEGKSLRERQKAQRKFTVEEAIEIIKQTASGLGAAHQQGITHRDIKPENVMIKEGTEEVKIMDFGLAHLDLDEGSNITQEGMVMGTLKYMAPEQVKGDRCDPPADIYATGIMFYELIAGDLPFTAGNIGFHHMNTVPTPLIDIVPGINPDLSEIVARCLEKAPEARYANGDELYDILCDLEKSMGTSDNDTVIN